MLLTVLTVGAVAACLICTLRLLASSSCSRRLEDIGFGVGLRLLELLVYRERGSKREVQLLKALVFLQTTMWRYLFGRDAQDLEQSNAVTPLCLCQWC